MSRSQDGPGSAGALGASGGSNDEFDDGEDEAKVRALYILRTMNLHTNCIMKYGAATVNS